MTESLFDLDTHPDHIEAVDMVDAMLFTGGSLYTESNVAVMNNFLERWGRKMKSIERITHLFEHDFATTAFANASNSYVVSINPDFADTDALGFAHGVRVLFRNFSSQRDAETFADELNIVFNKSFRRLKDTGVDPNSVSFLKTSSLDDNYFLISLNRDIFEYHEQIVILHLANISSEESQTTIKWLNAFFSGCYKEYPEEVPED